MFEWSFNPEKSEFDELMQLFLHSKEHVKAVGPGGYKVFPDREESWGKLYVTNLRIAVIPKDRSKRVIHNLMWEDVVSVQSKKHLHYSAALLTDRYAGLTSFGSVKKSIIKEIDLSFSQKSRQILKPDETTINFNEKAIATFCMGCSSQILPPITQCADCLRKIVWPESMMNVIALAANSTKYIPKILLNGEPSRGDLITKDVAILSAVCYCLGELDFVAEAERWAETFINSQAISPTDFADFPVLKRFGPHAENERLWNDARKLPAKLHGL
jgi:hypothetical protein